MPDPWGTPNSASAAPQGYMDDAAFASSMDSIYGPGNWRQTGGWRSQAREEQLREQGAQTVAPGRISAHSLGTADAPGARDVRVNGETPQEAAARIRAQGFPAAQVYPEGAAGGQGAHLHIGLAAGVTQDPWGTPITAGGPAADPWGPAITAPVTPGAPTSKGGLLASGSRLVGSLVGGAAEGTANIERGLGALDTAEAREKIPIYEARLRAGTPGTAQYASDLAALKQYTANLRNASPGGQGANQAQATEDFAARTEPKDRSGLESFLHGAGEFVPGIGAAALSPALGAGSFGASGFGQTYEEAKAHGADEATARRAALESAGVQGGLGALPVGHLAGPLVKSIERPIVGAIARTAAEAGAQGGLMGGMQTGENVIAQQNFDPNRPTFQGVPEAVGQGAFVGGAFHGAGEAYAGVKGALRPREQPPAPPPEPGKPPPGMPETVAAQAYKDMTAARGKTPVGANDNIPGPPGAPGVVSNPDFVPPALGPDGVPLSAKGQPIPDGAGGVRIGGRRGPSAGVETFLPGGDGQSSTAPAGPETIPTKPPADYEQARQAEGAPPEQMPQAIADFKEWKSAAPKGYSLFQAIKDMGGIKLKGDDGSLLAGPDAAGVLKDIKRPGLVSKTGMSPHLMASALADRGWFGPNPGDPAEAFMTALEREAGAGKDPSAKVYHPEATTREAIERRALLDADMAGAGVTRQDSPAEAAAKLAAYRQEMQTQASPEMDALRARADLAGVTHVPGMTYDEMLHDVVKAESAQGEQDGWATDHNERLLDDHILTPEDHQWLTAAGRSPESERDTPVADEALGYGAPPEREAPEGDRNGGEDTGHAGGQPASVPEGAQLARVDPHAIVAAWEKGYGPFKDRYAEIERAALANTEITVPVKEWDREVADTPFEAHIRANTRFDGPERDPWKALDLGALHMEGGHLVGPNGPLDAWRPHPDGGDYRIVRIKVLGDIPQLDRRYESGNRAAFYIGADGKLIDADNVNLLDPRTVDQLWKPKSDAERLEGERLLDERGKIAGENRTAREANSEAIRRLVSGEGHPSESVNLGGERVEQGLFPGGEASARQAAAAREGALKAKAPQQGAGPLFEELDKTGDLFSAKPSVPNQPNERPAVNPKFEELKARNRAQREEAAKLAEKGEQVRMTKETGQRALVGPDLNNPGKFRATLFSANGEPWGHEEFPTLEAAILDQLTSGFKVEPERPQEAAEARRPEPTKPETKRLEDAGEKIGGARKDRWAERGLRLADLEGMTKGEEHQYVVKDHVWPKPDYAARVADGADPEAVALTKIIRDRLAARPRDDTDQGRRNYIIMMGHIRDVLEAVKTVADAQAASNAIIYGRLKWPERYGTADKEMRDTLFSVMKGRKTQLGIGGQDVRKARQMVEAGFPGEIEPWTRRFDVRQASDGTFGLYAKGQYRPLERGLPTREEAADRAKTLYEEAKGAASEGDKLPERPHLDRMERTGPDVRAGKDVGGDDFVKDFGFRGVEFGNWVASDERQKSVNLAYDALHDLAGVLHIPPEALSLDGKLGLAFGSRGKGRAAAHYEPGKLVINLTKLSGGGSLAHEWAHAVDHYFGELDREKGTAGQAIGATGWYDRVRDIDRHLANLRPEMRDAFRGILEAMFARELPRAEAVRDVELTLEKQDAELANIKDRSAKSANKKYQQDVLKWLPGAERRRAAMAQRLADLRDPNKPYHGRKVASNYAKNASDLSGKSGDKGYWARPTEMFARAFESYVFDKLRAQDRESQYLVQGVEPTRYAVGYKGNPYPAGMERDAINAAFDHLVNTIKTRPGERAPVMYSRELHPDLFAHMEPLADRAPKGPFAEPAPDPAKQHFDQNHADLNRLGELARSGNATPAQLNAEAERLAEEMGRYMDWTDVEMPRTERQRIERTGLPSTAEMIRAAKDYVQDHKESGQTSYYDSDAYNEIVRRWYERQGGERPQFQRGEGRPPPFYSALERNVERNPQKQASADPWMATLKNAPGVKKEDLEWVGLEDWLKLWGDKPVPKEAVQAFVRDNGVKVEEANLGEPMHDWTPEELQHWEGLNQRVREADAEWERLRQTDDQQAAMQARERADAVRDEREEYHQSIMGPDTPTQYQDWKLPGGSDYRELLLTLPDVANPPATHWDTPGVMAHVRFDTRTAPDGKKVLFIEEVQSDWHQKGRDQGYAQPGTQEESDRALAAREEAFAALGRTTDSILAIGDQAFAASGRDPSRAPWRSGWHPDIVDDPTRMASKVRALRDWLRGSKTTISPELEELLTRQRAEELRANEAHQAFRRAEGATGIPDAPFKSSWPALVMKRMIVWAADHGYDRVAWTTGGQQSERYGLGRHVERIDVVNENGQRMWWPRSEQHGVLGGIRTDPDGTITMANREAYGDIVGRNIAELVGRDIAERGLATTARETHLEGADLDVGGSGMRAFYDRNLVNITNDLIKRYGGKVEKKPVQIYDVDAAQKRRDAAEWAVRDHETRIGRINPNAGPEDYGVARRARLREAERELANTKAGEQQHGFDLTDKLKEAASGGMPLFQRPAGAEPEILGKGGQLIDSLYGHSVRKPQPSVAALIDKVHAEIARLAPFAETKAYRRLTDTTYAEKGYRVMGAHYRDGLKHVIAWSLESNDPIRTGRHEAVHALRAAGLIDDREWHALESHAIDQGWLDRYNVATRYKGEGYKVHLEEAIADGFAEGQRDPAFLKSLPPFVQAIFRRMRDLFTKVASMTREALGASVTGEEVLRRIEGGEIGARSQQASGEARTSFSREPTGEPEEPEAKRSRGIVNRFLGEGIDEIGRKITRAAARYMPDPVQEMAESMRMGLNPMSEGSPRAQAMAKDFANALREHTWEWTRMDRWLEKTFTPEQRKAMWEAADEESIIRQGGAEPGPGQGLSRLDPGQRAVVEEMQKRANRAFAEAQELGMTKAAPLPSYVPHMVIEMTAEGGKRLKGERTGTRDGVGRNLTTTTPQLRGRKYLTPEEAEAAASTKFNTTAMVIRDIRTLAHATGKLEQANAGKRLVNGIRDAGKGSGQVTVSEGAQADPAAVFTLDHPALRVWGPVLRIDHETGKPVTVGDPSRPGQPLMEAKPLYISKEFEGPLRAVLSQSPGMVEKALMTLKGKAMSVIMYSPLMHNAVIWGKALPVMLAQRPDRAFRSVFLFDTYFRGSKLRNDPTAMREALKAGLDPIGRHYFNQDITALLQEPQIAPGRSWTAQLLGGPVSLINRGAGDAVKRAVDRAGNLWHNTFLWDRVADLQMGLYDTMRQGFVKHGLDPETSNRLAAHFANRYAGALPMEAMSRMARNTANIILFSRSFTLTNLGAWKDAIAGLPSDIQAQIARDKGMQELRQAQGTARGKAMQMIALDLVAAHVSQILGASAVWGLYNMIAQQPWALQIGNQIDLAATNAVIKAFGGTPAVGPNEPGKDNRILIGYDQDGTALYARLPTGKFIEDIFGWVTDPIGEAERKFSPFMRFAYQMATNDKGFGRKLYDPYDKTPPGMLKNLSRIIFGADLSSLKSADDFSGGLMGSFTPVGLIQGAAHWAGGQGDTRTAMLQTLLPVFGVTVSKGAPGGPAAGDLYHAKDEHDFQVNEALPGVRSMIRSGKLEEARVRMHELGIPIGLQKYYIRTTLNPATRLSGRALRDFRLYGSPDDIQRLDEDRAAAAARQRAQ